MKSKPPGYLESKTECPAKAYRHPEGRYYCYAKTFWGSKSQKWDKAPICDEAADYCEFINKAKEVPGADRKNIV